MESQSGFATFGLDPRVGVGVQGAGYTQPTPIQSQTISAAVAGRHVLGLAQTGTGKTAAFVLPILDRLLADQDEHGPRRGRRRTRALVVAPTRELAEQINDEFRSLGRATGLYSATVYGGVGFQPQIRALRGGADIIVACPGRLLDHMERGNADLTAVEALVLDEADQLFDMGFLPAVRRLLKAVPNDAQRMLFSATMPAEVMHLADEVLTDPLKVEIARQAPADTIDHSLVAVDEENKRDLLLDLLKGDEFRSTLVFTRTKHRAKRLAEQLDKANVFATDLQGNLSQRRRQAALDGFKDGTYHVLVATDIAARGIDVAGVSHVINYDFPDTPEAYTHRIGRTGRAQLTGKALTFVTTSDFGNVRQLERQLKMRIERESFDGYAGPTEALERLKPSGRDQEGRSRNRGGGRGKRHQGNGSSGRTSGRTSGRGDGRFVADRDGSGTPARGSNEPARGNHASSGPASASGDGRGRSGRHGRRPSGGSGNARGGRSGTGSSGRERSGNGHKADRS